MIVMRDLKKYNHLLPAALILSAFLISPYLSAADIYVKTTGTSSSDGITWQTATTLSNALSVAQSGDIIHLAAGNYTPDKKVSGGSLNEDVTFEIKSNISLTGGYPANPVNGDLPDGSSLTVLNGNSGNTQAFHVVAITAPMEANNKVELRNLTITGGKAGANNSGSISANGISYPRYNGGGMIIGKSTVELYNCRIHNNQSLYHTPGVYVFSQAKVTFSFCTIENNTGAANGGGIWNDGSTVSLYNCNISNNETIGVGGGIYALNLSTNSKTYMYNSTINHNKSSHKAGYYGREKSIAVMVNCTVYGNSTTRETTGGGGISLYTNNQKSNAAKLDIISSTITGNTGALNDGGGIRLNDQYCKLSISNSVVSGNSNEDIALFNGASYSVRNTVISDKVYSPFGEVISGQTFDHTSMIETLADNGGYNKTCRLGGNNNPALISGMSSAELITLASTLSPAIPFTVTGEKLVRGTGLFEQIQSDTSYTVKEGVTATEISYISTASQAMKLFVFEVDLTNPYISIEASTPNNATTFTRQKMTEQAVYEDQPGHIVYGGINGDFFDLTTGVPRSILYKSGVAVKTAFQDVNRIYFAITKDKKAIVGDQNTYPMVRNNIQEAVGGLYWLVRDSTLSRVNNTTPEPRTCAGVSKDGKKVFFLAVDGRSTSYSNGMSFEELSKCMLALGAYNAVNLDGGGSTTFFVRNTPEFTDNRFEIRNRPSDAAGERAVANGLILISTK